MFGSKCDAESNSFEVIVHNHRRSRSSFVHSVPVTCLIACCWSLSVASGAQAPILTVDRIDDVTSATTCNDLVADDCSLRGAILAANELLEAARLSSPQGRMR